MDGRKKTLIIEQLRFLKQAKICNEIVLSAKGNEKINAEQKKLLKL